MNAGGRWTRAAAGAAVGAVLVWLLVVALRGGWDTADPMASVLGGAAALVALLLALRSNALPEPEQLACELARQVVRIEQVHFSELIGGDLSCLIDLEFTASAHGHVAAPPPAGRLETISDFYRQLSPGRLVITGTAHVGLSQDAGTGKSVTAVALILRLAGSRQAGEAVPLRLSAPSWPGGTITAWLRTELADVWRLRPGDADLLLQAHLVVPVIDGLDEMDPGPTPGPASRAAALLTEINAFQRGTERAPVVLACRWPQYESLTLEDVHARTVTRIQLAQVTAEGARAYLEHRVADSAIGQERWQPVLDALFPRSASTAVPELQRALDTPWRLALAVRVYQERTPAGEYCRSPHDLLALATSGSIYEHLLERYIPASLASASRGPLHRMTPDRAQRHLAYLACYLHGNSTRRGIAGRVMSSTDLVLHELWPAAGPRRAPYAQKVLGVAMSLVGAATTTVLERLTGYSWKEALLAASIFACPVFAVVVSFPWFGAWPSPRRINVRQIRTRRGQADLTGVLIVTILLTALTGIFSGFISGLQLGLLIGVSAATGITGELGGWLLVQNGEPVTDPRDPVRADTASLVMTAVVFTGACTAAGALGDWSPQWLSVSVAFSLAFAAPAASVRYLALLLCTRRNLPWRLSSFLHTCHEVGILRSAGHAYQFRHRELQDHLAIRAGLSPHS
ncbi:hypothetical protein [Streptomyces platensis]|uniref:hypothetical protein n=1 Tax=Streptomyces platensis TaxID=58346 RepID=UPI0037B1F5CF